MRRDKAGMMAMVVAGLMGAATTVAGQNDTSATLGSSGAYACDLRQGMVRCWGRDRDGELGDGHSGFGRAEASLVGLPERAMGISLGGHACAWSASGRAWCWGRNNLGQLGPAAVAALSSPVEIPNLSFSAVAAGGSHACGIAGGDVWCWGGNFAGQLGNGTQSDWVTPWPQPKKVANLGGTARAISAGPWHTCALLTSGEVRCWGDNGHKQLGTHAGDAAPNNPVALHPVTAPLGKAATSVSVGIDHTCATLVDGSVSCWGYNGYGQSGGALGYEQDPFTVIPANAVGVAAGGFHTCALMADGSVKCWGDNSWEQLGVPIGSNGEPGVVTGLPAGAVALAAGGANTCVRMQDSDVRCWGYDGEGGLGDGQVSGYSTTPVKVHTTEPIWTLDAGTVHTCAIGQSGAVSCWGASWFGVLGSPGYDALSPRPATLLPRVSPPVEVGAGAWHTCLRHGDGAVQCWGSNDFGMLGSPSAGFPDIATPVWSSLPSPAVRLDAGAGHSCAIDGTSKAFCWGDGLLGQLGSGAFFENGTWSAQYVQAPFAFTDVQGGYDHSCGVSAGKMYCWGGNDYGQLGVGTIVPNGDRRAKPQAVPLPQTVARIAVGGYQSCAMTDIGTTYCWGAIGAQSIVASPQAMTFFSGVVEEIAIGGTHFCARLASGAVECAGTNDVGQLARTSSPNPLIDSANPVALPAAAKRVVAGYDFTCAQLVSNEIYCWGSNSNGQLGIGKPSYRAEKKRVVGLPLFYDGFDLEVMDIKIPRNPSGRRTPMPGTRH